jgi:hypothetical protein
MILIFVDQVIRFDLNVKTPRESHGISGITRQPIGQTMLAGRRAFENNVQ